METSKLRKKLIDKINTIQDQRILEDAIRLLNISNVDEKIYRLSADQNNAIEEARESYKNGRYLTQEDANLEIEQWLNE